MSKECYTKFKVLKYDFDKFDKKYILKDIQIVEKICKYLEKSFSA